MSTGNKPDGRSVNLTRNSSIRLKRDFATAEGVQAFFDALHQGYFDNDSSVLSKIVLDTEIAQAMYWPILKALNEAKSDQAIPAQTLADVQLLFANKLDLSEIETGTEMAKIELLDLLIEADLLKDGRMDEKLKIFAQNLDIEALTQNASEFDQSSGNIFTYLNGYNRVFDTLNKAKVFELYPNILETFVDKMKTVMYGLDRLGSSLINNFNQLKELGVDFGSNEAKVAIDKLADVVISSSIKLLQLHLLNSGFLDNDSQRLNKVYNKLMYGEEPKCAVGIVGEVKKALVLLVERGIEPPTLNTQITFPAPVR